MVMGGKSQVLSLTMTDISQEKATYRAQAREHRDKLPAYSMDFERVIEVFFDEISPDKGQKIAVYWPVGKEFDGRFLMDDLIKRGFTCLLPKVLSDSRVLSFVTWTPDIEMEKGAFDVMEPNSDEAHDPDIVLAPLLAFDQRGTRLGQGGGYYDATIESLRAKKEITYAGPGYSSQAVLFNLPKEDHDQTLDCMVTPDKVAFCTH